MSFIDTIIETIHASGYDTYKIIENVSKSNEGFIVDGKVDMFRSTDIIDYTLTAYQKVGDQLGVSSCSFGPTLSQEELKTKIEDTYKKASVALNQYYDLAPAFTSKSSTPSIQPDVVIQSVLKAVQAVQLPKDTKINSYEIFSTTTHVHIVTSNGVDVEFDTLLSELELVVNVFDAKHEIEVLSDSRFSAKSAEEIQKDIEETILNAQNMVKAIPNTHDDMHVLISGKDIREFLNYYVSKCSAQMIYNGMSSIKENEAITKECRGDSVTIRNIKDLPLSSNTSPCDNNGVACKDFTIIKDNVCEHIVSDLQFGYYLNSPATAISNICLEGGKYSQAELKKDPYLECVEFSAFSLNPTSGDYMGEIRLAYYYDGKTITPVKGGSISGNMKDTENEIYFSSETKQYNSIVLPKTIRLTSVNIALA